MAIGVAGLAAGLAVGGLVMVAALGLALQRSIDAEALGSATDVARLVDSGQLPDPVPVAGSQYVQVVDAQSRVRAASINADRLTPLLHPDELARVRAGARLYVPGSRVGSRGLVRVVGVRAGSDTEPLTVLAGKPTSDVAESFATLRVVLLVAFPVLVLALALVAWRVIGATLRPVEGLRRGAEEITGGARPGRLPVPESRDEIFRLAETLNGMLARLDAARARQRAFVADAAHELRSPLTNMRTELEVARRLGDRTDWTEVADDLLIDMDRLARLVDDLLLLARADDAGGRAVRVSTPVELAALAGEVAQRCTGGAPVTVRPGPPLWTAGDPDDLRRLLANLVDNATRHARSRVEVAVTPDGPYQLVTVADDGPGIPAADRERVFDRFTRLDDGRARDAGGAGLGLAIVRELVRRYGGTVRLTDAQPGVRAEVRLPAVPADS
ncbi:sensor histidine kinase [Rhizomonospora bruguierae]|uniref:sensor histidine kinase n=1 Tax=Rhizomonospora bruguierae TaxID=1581705 RepID=UPI001BCF83D7|nr:HAMP domain-containing sensor histidine kinase [Micromonospora sp. NBRC 107566]